MATDPVLAQLESASEADVWRLGRITPREKIFIALVANVCQSTASGPFARHVEQAKREGVTVEDIREAIRFMAYDSGYHVAVAAMERLDEIEKSTSADTTARVQAIATLAAGTANPLPGFVRARLDDLGEQFTGFMGLQSRMRSDTTLSQRERAFMTMTIDVIYQTLDDTFRMHATRALSNGADRETVHEALCFGALFGAARAWNALRALKDFYAELDAKT
jgi:alkylhydroperoxidase/carboxymuconolactone decarboxylase family protein YurZ